MKNLECNKSIAVLFGFVLLIGLLACEKEKININEIDTFIISYSKASSWVDYLYEAKIDQNGNIEIIEKNSISNKDRDSQYQISNTELNLIKDKLNNLLKIDISDKYGFDNEMAPTDLPTTKLMYKTMTKSDSVAIYFPIKNELPLELDFFMQTIEQVILNNDTLINY